MLNGKPDGKPRDGGVGKQLSDADIAAVITYERNSWGNKTGEAIQPAEVQAGAEVTRASHDARDSGERR